MYVKITTIHSMQYQILTKMFQETFSGVCCTVWRHAQCRDTCVQNQGCSRVVQCKGNCYQSHLGSVCALFHINFFGHDIFRNLLLLPHVQSLGFRLLGGLWPVSVDVKCSAAAQLVSLCRIKFLLLTEYLLFKIEAKPPTILSKNAK